MSSVRGVCFMRKLLSEPLDFAKMPSMLGSIFRNAYYGNDDFEYKKLAHSSDEDKLASWQECRGFLGMTGTPEALISFGNGIENVQSHSHHHHVPHLRQQYVHSH